MSTKKLDELGVSAFCESMGLMAKAGIQTDEALTLLSQGEYGKDGILGQALTGMRRSVEDGKSLAEAMEESGIFDDYCLRMVAAGRRSGRMEEVLLHLSRYYARQKTISEKVKSAIVYPSTMLIMIIVVLAVMLAMVLPAFTRVYNSLTGSLADSSYGYVTWAYGLCWVALVVMVILAIVLIGGRLMWNGSGRDTVRRTLFKIPAAAGILKSMGKFRFVSAFETFLASGEMQDTAVLDSIPMTDCPPVEESLKKCAIHMEEGHGFAQSAFEEELFEPVYGRMLLAGERSGDMETVLERLADHLEEDYVDRVDRLVSVIDPVLSGVMLVTVGVSLLSVMLPLIGMMSAIG